VSREKSMMGIESSGSSETGSSSGLRVKVYLGGMEVRPGDSATSALMLVISGTYVDE
jgi:hypothetical protein